ncbi:uncharacterized protein LOC128401859 [Podarcis raffonei]|uniref:uncharacterized protein LOC128401859 n=1 Tax=Podarcis raffonei TaxID=65483 RepID=UPI00232918BA|nr:uncharacterized protein LOC128401859 [Podarcis raffonei]
MTSSSRDWLQENFGLSSSFADYNDFLHLNPSFNGFEVLDLLTTTQMGTLLVISGTLTDSARVSAETEATNVMATLQSRSISELQSLLLSIQAQGSITEITNVRVREIMLRGIFQLLKPHFASMPMPDLLSWFNGLLIIYFPSITVEELGALPTLPNCTQIQPIVKGLDSAFDQMSLETKTGVAQWILQALRKTDCQMTGNWLSLNFQRFKSFISITDLMSLDPSFNGTANLGELSAVQLAQLTVNPEMLCCVDKVKMVFTRLAQLPGLDHLAAFWDAFNIAYKKPSSASVLNISMDVKMAMLTLTMERLSVAFSTFTNADFRVWFEDRLVVVLSSVNAEFLGQIPKSISCEAYKSVIAGINRSFSEIPQERKKDCVNYIVSFLTQKSQTTGPACFGQTTARNWLLTYFGQFYTEVPYVQLVSYYRQTFDAYAVLDLLTPIQIGDMIVHSNTLTSMDLALRLVNFFQESSVDFVQMILKQFTRAAIQHKMTVLPNTEVAQLLLTNYLTLASSQMETYTAADWNATFQGELRFLCSVVNATTLAYFAPQNYNSFTAIVAGLSGAHSQMAEPFRRAVVLWIIQNLKDLKEKPSEPFAEWIKFAWGSFFKDATLGEVESIKEDFDPFAVLNTLSTEQLVDVITTSDALVNVTTLRQVLLSLETGRSEIPLAKMDVFLTRLNFILEQKNIPGIRNAEVRLELLSTIFRNLARYFRKFTALDYQNWFTKKLKLLLPSINVNLLQMIPLDVSFASFRAIFGGFDQVFPELPEEASIQIYNLMKRIMQFQINASGTAFPGAYNNSQSFLQLLFYRFVRFVPYADLAILYPNFNGFEALSALTPKQMGAMMVFTNAFRNERLAVQILAELEKRPPEEMRDFTAEFNAAVNQRQLLVLPDLRIRNLIFEMVFKTLKFSTFSAEQYSFWFGTQLQFILPSLKPKDLLLIPLDIDCQSHQNLVQAMDKVFDRFTEGQKKAIHARIFSYLESYQADQGVTCSPNTNSSQWILSNYGQFSAFASIAEFLAVNVNFNGISAMAELSANQLAELAVESGALADGSGIMEIMGNLKTVEDLARFLGKLNTIAPMELQSSSYAGSILSIAFQRIAINFPKFKASDFAYWFQVIFQNVLHEFNETLVVDIPLKISCDSYQKILKGFNNVFANILPGKALSVFGFSKAFLTTKIKSGIACGRPTQSVQEWLEVNLGNFSQYAQYQDLLSWNLHFDGMAVLQSLSPLQLASLTLKSDAINEEEKMCQILARLQNKPLEEIYQYLDQFNTDANKLGITSLKEEGIRQRVLSHFVEAIGSELSTFSPANWTHLLSTRLLLFLPSVSAKESKEMLSYVSGCDAFQAVVSSLSQVYSAVLPTNQLGVYRTLFSYLDNQHKTTGSACTSNTGDSEAWLQDNLGAFAAQAPYGDFTMLMATFNGFDVRGNLTATQLAHVFFASGALDDPDKVSALLEPLENKPVDDTLAFMTEFAALAAQSGVTFLANTEVRDKIFDVIFSKLQSLLPTAGTSQYEDWFQKTLTLVLPSINSTALAAIPQSIPCSTFKAIMAGLDGSFRHMSSDSRQDVYNFAKGYLMTKTSQGGDPCTENTRGSLGWLTANFGSFSSLASYKDLVAINGDFHPMDAVARLTPSQLAEYTLASDTLRDSEKAGKVFGSLDSNNIGEFMDAFNAAAQQHQLTQLPNLETKRFILGEIFCHLSGVLKLFTTEDYAAWFGQRLPLFLSSLDAQNLGFLPSDMSCDSLAAIVEGLNDHHANSTFENPDDIFSFIKRILEFQEQNSGSACTQGASTDQEWLSKFFGPFSAYGSYSDFTALKSDFRGVDSLDLFSTSALAQLSTEGHTIYSSSAMVLVFQAIQRKKEPEQFLSTYLDEFNTLVLKNRGLLSNPKVRDTMLMLSAEIIFPQIATSSLEDTNTWFQKLSLLLPGVNGTILELLPLGMPCPYYQTIVKAMDGLYSTLSARKRQDVYDFQKAYLAYQFADSESACDGGTTGIRDWLTKNLGEFCAVAKLSELQAFYPELDGVSFSRHCAPAGAAPPHSSAGNSSSPVQR